MLQRETLVNKIELTLVWVSELGSTQAIHSGRRTRKVSVRCGRHTRPHLVVGGPGVDEPRRRGDTAAYVVTADPERLVKPILLYTEHGKPTSFVGADGKDVAVVKNTSLGPDGKPAVDEAYAALQRNRYEIVAVDFDPSSIGRLHTLVSGLVRAVDLRKERNLGPYASSVLRGDEGEVALPKVSVICPDGDLVCSTISDLYHSYFNYGLSFVSGFRDEGEITFDSR